MKKLFKLSRITSFTLIISGCVSSTNTSNFTTVDVRDYYETLSLQDVTQKANLGDIHAQAELGYRYLLSKDDIKAIELLRPAAQAGSIRAMNSIGTIYADSKNFSEARKWYKKATQTRSNNENKSKALAYSNLAKTYLDTNDITENLNTALELYLQSENLYPNSATELDIGWIAEKNKNYSDARKWYKKAARNSREFGTTNINRSRAIAYGNLGHFYNQGDHGVAKNLDKALDLYLKAESLYPRAEIQRSITDIYEQKNDYLNAAKWRKKAK